MKFKFLILDHFLIHFQREDDRVSKANELSLANVGGVFVVLLAGMGLACLIAVFEFIWKSRKLATEDNVRHSTLICKGFSHTSKHLFVINKQKSPKSSNPTNPPNNDTEGSACRPPVLLRQIKPSVVDYILEL